MALAAMAASMGPQQSSATPAWSALAASVWLEALPRVQVGAVSGRIQHRISDVLCARQRLVHWLRSHAREWGDMVDDRVVEHDGTHQQEASLTCKRVAC